jgi:hypothetical protein
VTDILLFVRPSLNPSGLCRDQPSLQGTLHPQHDLSSPPRPHSLFSNPSACLRLFDPFFVHPFPLPTTPVLLYPPPHLGRASSWRQIHHPSPQRDREPALGGPRPRLHRRPVLGRRRLRRRRRRRAERPGAGGRAERVDGEELWRWREGDQVSSCA